MKNDQAQQVAATILEQLGGNMFCRMTGAYNLCFSSAGCGSLQLRFKGSKKANFIKVTLNGLDLYDVEIGKVWGTKYKVVETLEGAYNDMLAPFFERVTGLYTKLF